MSLKNDLSDDVQDACVLLPARSYLINVDSIAKSRFNDQIRCFRCTITYPAAFANQTFSKDYDLTRTTHKAMLRQLFDALEDDSHLVQMEVAHFNGIAYPARFSKAPKQTDGGNQ